MAQISSNPYDIPKFDRSTCIRRAKTVGHTLLLPQRLRDAEDVPRLRARSVMNNSLTPVLVACGKRLTLPLAQGISAEATASVRAAEAALLGRVGEAPRVEGARGRAPSHYRGVQAAGLGAPSSNTAMAVLTEGSLLWLVVAPPCWCWRGCRCRSIRPPTRRSWAAPPTACDAAAPADTGSCSARRGPRRPA